MWLELGVRARVKVKGSHWGLGLGSRLESPDVCLIAR